MSCIHVTVVEMANQVMAPLDYSMAAIVHQQLIGKQVGLMLEDGVSRFEETSGGVTVHLKSGKQIPADMVLLSIGVRPETDWPKKRDLRSEHSAVSLSMNICRPRTRIFMRWEMPWKYATS